MTSLNRQLTLEASYKSTRLRKKKKKNEQVDDKPIDFFNGSLSSFDPKDRCFRGSSVLIGKAECPLCVFPDGHIFIEAFSEFFLPAYDFVKKIAECCSEATYIYEYQITSNSISKAIKDGITSNDIINGLKLFSKSCISDELVNLIKNVSSVVDKIIIVNYKNRRFVQCSQDNLINILYTEFNEFVLKDNDNKNLPITFPCYGIKPVEIQGLGRLSFSNNSPCDDLVIRCFEINPEKVDEVKYKLISKNFSFFEEHDYREEGPKIKISLKDKISLYDYQSNALINIFNDGFAKTGTIIIPYNGGKTLIGVATLCTIKLSTIIFCSSIADIDNWYNTIIENTNIDKKLLIKFSFENQNIIPPDDNYILLITYFDFIKNRETKRISSFVYDNEWGLLIMDDLQSLYKVNSFEVFQKINAKTRLGFASTQLKENFKLIDLNKFVGPKIFQAGYKELMKSKQISQIKCYEIYCTMAQMFVYDYVNSTNVLKKRIISLLNPNKFRTVERLIKYHEAKNDKIIVYSDIPYILNIYYEKLYEPKVNRFIITGKTTKVMKEEAINNFKNSTKGCCLFISRALEKSNDIPRGNVFLQISSFINSGNNELRNVLHALKSKGDSLNTYFYSIVSDDSKEMYFSNIRQQTFQKNGFNMEIVQNPRQKWVISSSLHYSKLKEQKQLLDECISLKVDSGLIEHFDDDERKTENALISLQKFANNLPTKIINTYKSIQM